MMPAVKRQASDSFSSSSQIVVKRQKSNTDLKDGSTVAVVGGGKNGALVQSVCLGLNPYTQHPELNIAEQGQLIERKMDRYYGQNMIVSGSLLEGHSGEVFATRFDPTGQHIASGSMDRSIMLWNTYGQCENYGTMTGHKQAILDLQWSRDSEVIFSASADMTVASWNLETGLRLRKHIGHEEVINCLDVSKRGQELLLSGSDDGYIGIWDPRQKAAVDFMDTGFPVTGVALAEAGNEIYSGGIDNDIKVWDARKQEVIYTLRGHTDTVTSLQISPDSQMLLSNSHDSTVRTWDIRPFAPVDRSIRTYDGAPTGLEKNLIRASWDAKGEKICAGAGDRTVVVWDARSGKLLYKLPGHNAVVNDVRFSPTEEPIIVSGSSDRKVLLGELGK